MADNPFYKTKEVEYRRTAIAYLKNLRYLDYELIDPETRVQAEDKMREEMQETVSQNQDGANDEFDKQADPALREARIDCTVGMI